MSDLPQWLDYAFSEHAATAMLRNLSSPLNTSWNELIASAQAVMSVFQEKSEDVTWYYDEQNANPLVAAARILDSASRAIMIESVEERTNLALTAAVAYSMYGNFPSASAVLNPLFNLKLGRIDSSKAVLIATCDPNRLQDAFEYVHPDDNPEERKYLELLNRFLFTGQENLIENIEYLFINSPYAGGLEEDKLSYEPRTARSV
jgi:hypothetical protein